MNISRMLSRILAMSLQLQEKELSQEVSFDLTENIRNRKL